MYTYKGKNYEIFNEGKMKNPQTREWVDCIIYMPRERDTTLYVREKSEFLNRFKEVEKIPYHIQVMGKLYNISKTEGNISTGEIRKFHFVESDKGIHKTGDQVASMERIDNKDYDAIWVHLAQDYFKMIALFGPNEWTCQ
jgi:hypothetical protein